MRQKIFGGLEKLKNIVNGPNRDYDSFEEEDNYSPYEEEMEEMMSEEIEEEEEQENSELLLQQRIKPRRENTTINPSPSFSRRRRHTPSMDMDSNHDLDMEQNSRMSSRFPSNVVGLPGVNTTMNEIEIFEPHTFEQASEVIKLLKQQRTVVLNLNLMESYEAQRAVDFVTGGTAALDGNCERVGESIFLFTPRNVHVTNSKGASSVGKKQENGISDDFTSSNFSDNLWSNTPLPDLSSPLAQ
ncbi:MAG: cell division protein SepF [Cyanobacterium sp.]